LHFRLCSHVPISRPDVLIVEGERDANTAKERLDLCGTTGGGAEEKWRDEYTATLADKNCVVIADADAPGRSKARKIAQALSGKAASVRLLEMPGAKDLTEWVEQGGTQEQFLALVKGAPEWKLEVVDGARLLDHVAAYIRRFVSLSESQARVAATWTVHTYTFAAADSTPYLAITSAEKQSGKTRLLEVFKTLVETPWFTGRVTAAVLTRKIDAERPTLLLDESDAAFSGEKEYAEALRCVLNTGHRSGGKASCCVGQGANISFKDFSTFCPKAIAGIGKLPDTVADRAIPIRLKRAAQDEKVERFRHRGESADPTLV
jgi:5S rRNA maturation endonuclease (ribonuclease M5)